MCEISHVSEWSDEMDDEFLLPGFLLPGFRFHPTDEELIQFYLRMKVENRSFSDEMIKEIDAYKFDPWTLSNPFSGEREWYFFVPNDRKNRNSSIRRNRVTETGFWKATGSDKPIYSSNSSRVIGLKKSLTFHHGQTPGKSIESLWLMDEFRLPEFCGQRAHTIFELKRIPHETDSWVICKITAQRGSFHNNYSKCMREHDFGPMEDRINRNMLNDLNLNKAANNGATEEPYDNNQLKAVMKDNRETCIDIDSQTCIDIDSHPGLSTSNTISIDPNQSSADFFYVLVAIILALTGQAAFTFTGLSSTSTLNCVGASTVVGFIGSLSAMLLRYKLPKIARYLGKVSVIIGAAAVVSVYAARFHQEVTLTWGLICGIALLIPSISVLFA